MTGTPARRSFECLIVAGCLLAIALSGSAKSMADP
jgi:hypothetical protein